MEEQKKIIQELVLANEKMTATLSIYNMFHLTKQEKQQAANSINLCQDSNGIRRTTENLTKQFNSAYQFSDEDSKWSPGFIQELLKYYENQIGFNPLERLKNVFAIIKAYFQLKENEDKLDELDKKQLEDIENQIPAAMKLIAQMFQELEPIKEDDDE